MIEQDGRLLVLEDTDAPERFYVNVVTNCFEELERLVPRQVATSADGRIKPLSPPARLVAGSPRNRGPERSSSTGTARRSRTRAIPLQALR